MSDTVRGLDVNGDWLYGKGRNDYVSNINAVAQSIRTRLNSFLGDCFFANSDGLDWFNLLGSKNQVALNLAVSAAIINTPKVTGILELSISISRARVVTIQYKVQTVYSILSSDVNMSIGV